MSKVKDKIYSFLVNKNERVKFEYERYVMEHTVEHYEHRLTHWKILFKLNWHYRIRKRTTPMLFWDIQKESDIGVNKSASQPKENIKIVKGEESKIKPTQNNNEKKIGVERENSKVLSSSKPYKKEIKSPMIPEYRYQFRHTIQQFIKIVYDYDVISFDIFDTLIFRPFNQPTDLFSLMEIKYDIPDFKRIRVEAEKKAREYAVGHEVNIEEIYKEIYKIRHIDINRVMQFEIDTEMEFCFANEYMKKVVDTLIRNGKIVIAISNMYLPESIISQLLKKCGYADLKAIYVSCDYHRSKGDKLLYRYVDDNFIKGRSVIHIGDNYRVDYLNAKECGWQAYHYPNCGIISNNFRPNFKMSIPNSIYRGIVATRIHNGIPLTYKIDKYYEYGFIYGGIIVCGFCEYLERLAKELEIDKIIFLARDGDIVSKIYNKYFGNVENDYMLWSRFMSTFLSIDEGVSELFVRNVNPVYDMVKDATIFTVLENINCLFLCDELSEYHMAPDDKLTKENIVSLKKFLLIKEEVIINHFKVLKEEAKKYIAPYIAGKSKVCLMDVGWSGKSIISFRDFVKKEMGFEGKVYGAMIGAFDRDFTNNLILSGELNSYLFSVYKNKNLLDEFAKNYFNKTIFIETLVTSPVPSVLSFDMASDEEMYQFIYGNALPENNEAINQIHKGISDFAKLYYSIMKPYRDKMPIQPMDAFLPINHFSENREWINYTFSDYKFDLLSGFGNTGISDYLPNILH